MTFAQGRAIRRDHDFCLEVFCFGTCFEKTFSNFHSRVSYAVRSK